MYTFLNCIAWTYPHPHFPTAPTITGGDHIKSIVLIESLRKQSECVRSKVDVASRPIKDEFSWNQPGVKCAHQPALAAQHQRTLASTKSQSPYR
jgi:hypothetical protein